MSEEKIKIIDRRRSANPDAASPEREEPKVDSSPPKEAKAPAPEQEQTSSPEQRQAGAGPQSGAQVDFPSFVVSFYTQAMIMLGEIPNPETGLVMENFEAARQTIDILVMMEEKTKGNLSPDESRLITEVVANLQMAYVKKVK